VLAPFFRRVTDAAVFLVEILMRVNCAGIWIAITLKRKSVHKHPSGA
jgi:hypothetical protein